METLTKRVHVCMYVCTQVSTCYNFWNTIPRLKLHTLENLDGIHRDLCHCTWFQIPLQLKTKYCPVCSILYWLLHTSFSFGSQEICLDKNPLLILLNSQRGCLSPRAKNVRIKGIWNTVKQGGGWGAERHRQLKGRGCHEQVWTRGIPQTQLTEE